MSSVSDDEQQQALEDFRNEVGPAALVVCSTQQLLLCIATNRQHDIVSTDMGKMQVCRLRACPSRGLHDQLLLQGGQSSGGCYWVQLDAHQQLSFLCCGRRYAIHLI